MSLWIELYNVFIAAYDEPLDQARIGKVYEYAGWCFAQAATGDVDTDPSMLRQWLLLKTYPLTSGPLTTSTGGCRLIRSAVLKTYFGIICLILNTENSRRISISERNSLSARRACRARTMDEQPSFAVN
jgi:hypothetical protein